MFIIQKKPQPAEPVKATYDALRFIYRPIYPPEFDTLSSFIYFKPEMITRYYEQLSLQNGYDVTPPEAVVDGLAHYLLSLNNSQNKKDAIKLLKINTNNYPASWHVYSSLGDVYYLKEQNKQLAINNYKRALELKPNNKSLQLKIQAVQQK